MNVQRASSAFLAAALSIVLLPAAYGQDKPANSFQCPADITGAELAAIPEITTANGMLKGTLYTVSEQQQMTTVSNGLGSAPYCFPQWVRAYRRSAPANWNPSSQQLSKPMPGPTLRARVGDIVALTFLNVIDPTKFPGVDDNRCDETGPGGSIYPGTAGTGKDPDTYPDCFAGSVFTNMHFHGTHTNPNSTGDNVFLQIRPSPRKTDGTNAPVITAESVRPAFTEFFSACEQQFRNVSGPKMWPRMWSDLPSALQSTLMDPLKQYAPEWWTVDQKMIARGDWPQYYVGAAPYCFKLPELKNAAITPADAVALTPHTAGAGHSEVDEAQAPSRPLLMGQAPGTHWYHAHKHGSTTINVMNGMTGAFIIEGEYDDALNANYGAGWTRRQPLLVVQQLGAVPGLMTGAGGGPGADFSVNGQLRPTITMQGNSVQMWRIANNSGRAGIFFQAPPKETLQWKQLAQDGVQFNAPNYDKSLNDSFLLAAGNRADLLVKAPAFNATAGATNTYDVLVFNTIDPTDRPPMKPNVAPFTLVTVKVTANVTPAMDFMAAAPAPFPDFLKDIKDNEVSGTKVITFASTQLGPPVTGAKFPSQHTIDGKKFDGELGVVVAMNRAEEWKIVNETYPPANAAWISHPFHIHINPFQVTEVFDPKDTLPVTDGVGTVSVTKIPPANPPATTPPAGNQATVTGTRTSFTRDFRVGDWIWIKTDTSTPATAGDPTMGPSMVSAIASDTSMTIDNAPGPANNPKVLQKGTYQIAVPLYTFDDKTPRAGQCVLKANDPESWKPCKPSEPATDRIWWDVFSMPSGSTLVDAAGKVYQVPGYFKMRSRFVDYSGYYVIHCHILAHEDRGMMTVVEVTPLQTPYSHH
jgi:FtsP/CotA-like multicopper oxidase with cupredoxin domain